MYLLWYPWREKFSLCTLSEPTTSSSWPLLWPWWPPNGLCTACYNFPDFLRLLVWPLQRLWWGRYIDDASYNDCGQHVENFKLHGIDNGLVTCIILLAVKRLTTGVVRPMWSTLHKGIGFPSAILWFFLLKSLCFSLPTHRRSLLIICTGVSRALLLSSVNLLPIFLDSHRGIFFPLSQFW